jgi:hypothetical protein
VGVGLLLSLLATEVEKWLPWVSAWLIRYEASKLPRLSERMQEQWLADETEDVEPVIVSAVGISTGSTAIGVPAGSVSSTGHAPVVFISHHGSTLSAELYERLRIVDVNHVRPLNLSRLPGSSGSNSGDK